MGWKKSVLALGVALLGFAGPNWAVPITRSLPPPPNDDCANALEVDAAPFMDGLDTLEATSEGVEPGARCYGFGPTVWYRFTPPRSGNVCVGTCGSFPNTILGAFFGRCSEAVLSCADPSRTTPLGGPFTKACHQFDGDPNSCVQAWHISQFDGAASCWYDGSTNLCNGCGSGNREQGLCTNTCVPSCSDPSRTIFAGEPLSRACHQFDGDSDTCLKGWHLSQGGYPASCWYDADMRQCKGCGPKNQLRGLCVDTCGPAFLCNDDACGLQSSLEFAVQAGVPVLLHVSDFAANFGGQVTFSLAYVGDDTDGDGVPDCADNCAYEPNNAGDDVQLDSDGNGRGDSCECGNADGNTTINIFDALHIAQATLVPPLVDLIHPRACDVDGNGTCDIFDALRIAQATLIPPLAQIVHECEAATVVPAD